MPLHVKGLKYSVDELGVDKLHVTSRLFIDPTVSSNKWSIKALA